MMTFVSLKLVVNLWILRTKKFPAKMSSFSHSTESHPLLYPDNVKIHTVHTYT